MRVRGSAPSGVGRWFDAFVGLTGLRLVPAPSPDEVTSARAFAATRIRALLPGTCLAAMGAMAAWSVVDAVLGFDDALGSAYFHLRVGIFALFTACWVALRFAAVARHPMLVAALLPIGAVAIVSASLGALGPDAPYFHSTYWLAFTTLPVLVPLGTRAILCMGVALVHAGGIIIVRPDVLAHPVVGVVISTVLGLGVLAWVLGHFLYLLLLNLFVARERLASDAATLERVVAERTAELRALSARLDRLREDERRLMAQEIHDALGQELTVVRYRVALAQVRADADALSAVAALDELDAMLERTGRTLRRILGHLRPVAVQELGLAGAIEQLVREVAQRIGFRAKLDIAPIAARDDVATMLFRATQEALTNVVKHADATTIEVTLANDTQLRLCIADDGRGLPDGPTRAGGLGLVGIRMRAEACGGSASWGRGVIGGTRIEVLAPLGSEAA